MPLSGDEERGWGRLIQCLVSKPISPHAITGPTPRGRAPQRDPHLSKELAGTGVTLTGSMPGLITHGQLVKGLGGVDNFFIAPRKARE